MAELAVDCFPGFSTERLRTAGGEVFARVGGTGPPLVLLHGYPQTHVCWHRVAPALAQRYTVIACDLPGYGESRRLSPEEADESAYSKREMARTISAALHALGLTRFNLAGHDRGARVAYRLALDSPESVERLAVLSILPTFAMWTKLQNSEYAMKAFRWYFLAQARPLPERLIAPSAITYLHTTLSEWTAGKGLSAFEPEALAAYETAFADHSIIAASCRDYRAGWTIDRLDDAADLESGRRIGCPTLTLWSQHEFPDENEVMSAWMRICADVRGRAFNCGHFLPEEAAEETTASLAEFFAS